MFHRTNEDLGGYWGVNMSSWRFHRVQIFIIKIFIPCALKEKVKIEQAGYCTRIASEMQIVLIYFT